MRKPRLKASITAPAPNRRLITLSRMSPVTRLIAMAIETTPAERTTLSEAGEAGPTTSLSVFFEKLGNRHDPRVVILDFVLFVGRMQTIIGKAKAHHYGRNFEEFRKIADDRNRSAAADEHCGTAQHFAEYSRRGVNRRMVRVHQNGGSRAQHAHFRPDPGGRVVLHKLLVGSHDFFGVLVWDHTHTDLRDRLGGNYCLGAGSREAPSDAMRFERRPRPHALQNAESRFASQARGSNLVLQKLLFAERQIVPTLLLRRSRRLDIVIHARDMDVAVGVLHLGQQLDQAKNRVRRRASVHARVQVAHWTGRLDFSVNEAAEPDAQRRNS